jgi:hypothetical protein
MGVEVKVLLGLTIRRERASVCVLRVFSLAHDIDRMSLQFPIFPREINQFDVYMAFLSQENNQVLDKDKVSLRFSNIVLGKDTSLEFL